MIRITRIIAKNKLANLLDLPGISKFEVKQSRQGLIKPILKVQLYFSADCNELNDQLEIMHAEGKLFSNNKLIASAKTSKRDGFVKESHFTKFKNNVTIIPPYKLICEKYTQEFFDEFNRS